MPINPAPGRLRQKDCESEVNLGYVLRPCLKTKQINIFSWSWWHKPIILAPRRQKQDCEKFQAGLHRALTQNKQARKSISLPWGSGS